LALTLLVLCRRWMDNTAYFYVLGVWSATTFVSMYGDMGTVISAAGYPLLAPEHNALTRFFVELHAWDRFITVAIVANICAVIWVAILAYRTRSAPAISAAGASP